MCRRRTTWSSGRCRTRFRRSVSGLPASEWITYYATFELVSLLNDQSKTLTEVADLMNFETASHFSRYVKKLLGKSPSEYRQK
ncbi:MAG: AraC family transcriptional regulator [Bacteroidaceae bacterium]|nr:AraC family transcriptional regulator [Bacteroidaceae bacterium]